MKKILQLMVVFLLLVIATDCFGEVKKYKVGVILPLSGSIASWGIGIKNTLLFAEKKIGNNSLELIFEDDQALGKNAVTAAQKLINIDKVDFAIVAATESMLSTAPIFEKNKVLVIAAVASGPAVSNAGDYIFRMWPSDALAGEMLARHVAFKHQKFGVLTEERGYPRQLSNAFIEGAKGTSLKLSQEDFTSEETDFRPYLLKLRGQNIEGLLINTNGDRAFYNILKQIKEVRWDVKIYGAYNPGNQSFLKLAGSLAEGIIFVDSPSIETSLTPEGKQLYQEFIDEYGNLNATSFIFPTSYELYQRLLELSVSSEDWRTVLYKGSFSGLFGDYSFDSNGDIVGVNFELKIIKGGVPVLLK